MSQETEIKQNNCLICGERKIYYNFSIGKFRVEKCKTCALMRINPQPTSHELFNLKQSNSTEASKSKKLAKNNSVHLDENHFDLIESYAGTTLKGSLLSIGYDQPGFRQLVLSRNLSLTQVPIDENSKEIAIESGTELMNKLEELVSAKKKFEIIILINILQQVRNPRTFLRLVRKLVNENGIVIAILPSITRPNKRQLAEFDLNHFWYFPRNALIRLFYDEAFGELRLNLIKDVINIKLMRLITNFFIKKQSVLSDKIFLFAKAETINNPRKLSIIMPAYNEAALIRNTIERVLAKKIDKLQIELIIVESNSTDGTREIVKEYEGREGVTLVWQDAPQGKGNAVRAGLNRVNGDYVLIQDADSEYDIEDYDALVEPLMAGETAFVLGARHGGGAWKMRQFENQKITGHLLNLGHWVFATLVNITYGLKLKDPFTMYKVFRADCLRGIKLDSNRFDFDYELLIKLVRRGYRPIEIPVNYRSRSFKEGKKINVFRDPWTWLFAIIKYKFQKI